MWYLMELWLEIMWKEGRGDVWWKDGQSCQRWKTKKKKRKKKIKEKSSLTFLRFYVERAWNQKKLSIGD